MSNFLTLVCVAQPLTIDDCMRYAVENSVSVGQKQLAHDDSKTNYSEAIASLFPAVNGSVVCCLAGFFALPLAAL